MKQMTEDYRHALVMHLDACWRLFKATDSRKPNRSAVNAAQDAVRSTRDALRAVTPSSLPGGAAYPCPEK